MMMMMTDENVPILDCEFQHFSIKNVTYLMVFTSNLAWVYDVVSKKNLASPLSNFSKSVLIPRKSDEAHLRVTEFNKPHRQKLE